MYLGTYWNVFIQIIACFKFVFNLFEKWVFIKSNCLLLLFFLKTGWTLFEKGMTDDWTIRCISSWSLWLLDAAVQSMLSTACLQGPVRAQSFLGSRGTFPRAKKRCEQVVLGLGQSCSSLWWRCSFFQHSNSGIRGHISLFRPPFFLSLSFS